MGNNGAHQPQPDLGANGAGVLSEGGEDERRTSKVTFVEDSGTSGGSMAPKVPLFKRRASRARSLHIRMRERECSHLDEVDPVEVSVPALKDDYAHGEQSRSIGQTTLTRSRRNSRQECRELMMKSVGMLRKVASSMQIVVDGLWSNGLPPSDYCSMILISPSGQCTTMDEDGESANLWKDAAGQGAAGERRPSNHRLMVGRFKFTLADMITDTFVWLMRQSKGKHIKASKDVLAMYHDLFLYGEVPLTIKVRTALRGWPLRTYLMWIEFVAAIVSVVLYIFSTYHHGPRKKWERVVELVCGLFFVVDYILNIYSAPVRLYYIFSTRGMIDFISTLPIILYWSPEKDSSAAILLFFRVLRVMPVVTQVGGLTGGAIKEQIFILVMYTFGVVFIAAGILQWVDNKATSQSVKEAKGCGDHGCLTFFDAFWFMIVTMSTVGFGDITPNSDWGRLVVLCVIIGALVILPPQINRILRLASRRPYGGVFAVRKVVGSRFIIISGNLSYGTVQEFLSEFYHPSHNKDMSAFPLRVVIMAPFKPSFELKTLLMHYKHSVEFIQGTPVKDSDLDRVSAKVASAFYLLADQQAKDPDAEDAAQIVRTLSVHRHCGPKVRVIVELLKPEKAASAIWDDTEHGIEIICLDIIRFKLLARSCHIHGLSTFIVNLFRSGLNISKPLSGHWMMQYLHGLHQGVFPVILPEVFHQEGLTFEQAAELVYRKYNVILFGVDVAHEEQGEMFREVLLYPKARVILASDVGLAIAKDLKSAEEVSKFDVAQPTHCLGLQKLVSSACVKAGLAMKGSQHAEDLELLEHILNRNIVKMGDTGGLHFNHKSSNSIATVNSDQEVGVKFPFVCGALEEDPQLNDIETKGGQQSDFTYPKGVSTVNSSWHPVLNPHTALMKGDKDRNVYRKHRVSIPEDENMTSHHRGRPSSVSQFSLLKGELKGDKNRFRETIPRVVDSVDMMTPKTPRRFLISLEDAINMAMSWPPLQQFDKPDPSILERRAPEILENLQGRSMNIVNLHVPHILVCIQGKWPTGLFYFVSQLRTPGLPNPPIVILHPHEPCASDWGCIGFFDHVYFVKGSPSYELDLVRAGVLQAEKVVILTQGLQLDQSSGEIANDEDRLAPSLTFTLDVNNVFITATVERLLRPAKERVIVELQQDSEIQYLQPRLLFDRRIFDSVMYKRNRSATFQFAPPYIDGKAFCPAALGFLMYATFYNRQTLSIVDQLISGGQVLESEDETPAVNNLDPLVRHLDQVPVPVNFVGLTFAELFLGMLRNQSILALGLYRKTGTNRSGMAFVYTNPFPTDVLEATDLVYILH